MNSGIQTGDIVARKSYGMDLYFIVNEINGDQVLLRGINYRLQVSAPLSDLEKVALEKLTDFKQYFTQEMNDKVNSLLMQRKSFFRNEESVKVPGKVLHIDADANYLKLCLNYYEKLEIPAIGEHMKEKDQPVKIQEALRKYLPDIVIITGHDSYSNLDDKMDLGNYRSSSYFVEAVQEARRYQPSKDSLIIFAGACQSYYEALMDAGANFASSPGRILIHALDPVIIAERIAFTSFQDVLDIDQVIQNTITGIQGIGGIQTRGVSRDARPDLRMP